MLTTTPAAVSTARVGQTITLNQGTPQIPARTIPIPTGSWVRLSEQDGTRHGVYRVTTGATLQQDTIIIDFDQNEFPAALQAGIAIELVDSWLNIEGGGCWYRRCKRFWYSR